jgi:diguanylate cyclase (GGDEF)-like protein/PAS domain S-box-containing protein
VIVESAAEPSKVFAFDGMAILRRKWRAALAPEAELPQYEDVMLGSLGRLADDSFVMGRDSDGDYRVLYAGQSIAAWIDVQRGKKLTQLPPDCRNALKEALESALHKKSPVSSVTHRVRDGMVETLDLLTLPLANRWGEPLVGGFARAKGAAYNLVDAIFRSVTQGVLALTPIRNAADEVVDFQIVALNKGACRMLRQSEQELRWRRLGALEFEALRSEMILARLRATLQTGEADQFEAEFRLPDRVAHFYLSIASIGELVAVTFGDVTQLKEREVSFRLLFDENPAPMYLYDPHTLDFIGANAAATRHYGYSSQQFLKMNLLDICADEKWRSEEGPLTDASVVSVFDCEMRHRKADGSEIDVLAYARPISFHGKSAKLVTIMDITERRRAEARIAHMAHHDALTGLANRARFNAQLAEELRQVRRHGAEFALLCLDLDRFKAINDTLGHQVGDRLLQIAASRINELIHPRDLAARLGGDEFVVIRKGASCASDASLLASRLLTALSAPYEVDGQVVIVGASIGVALAPRDGADAETLLRNADMALYHAKENGRGTFRLFDSELDHAIETRRQLELDLRLAFSRGELELHYQPLFDLANGEISSFEALLRWPRGPRGFMPPSDFIPLAEEIELIIPLGEWVIRTACAEAAKWPEHIKVSVNLSPVQFKSKNLVPAIMGALASSGLSPQRLELEITESVLLKENEENLATLHQLRALGVRVVMDDFGTGYSSLSYLRSFPFDKIKIDKSFVNELASRPDCLAIVRAVIGLATSLGIDTTAEGVETERQLDCLRAEGCTEAQGFLLSRPQPVSAVDELLRRTAAAAGLVA